jgi:hypothetical protein
MFLFIWFFIRPYLSHDVTIIIAPSPISIHSLFSIKNVFSPSCFHQFIQLYLSHDAIYITLNKNSWSPISIILKKTHIFNELCFITTFLHQFIRLYLSRGTHDLHNTKIKSTIPICITLNKAHTILFLHYL